MRNIDDILLDHLLGETLPEEEGRVLDEWLRRGKNGRLVAVLEKMSEGRGLRQELRRQPDRGMRMIQEKIRRQRRRTRLRRFCSAAACVLLLAGSLFVLTNRESDTATPLEMVCSLWTEEENAGVRLRLGNGEEVSLEDYEDRVVVADSFCHARNESNRLVYSDEAQGKDTVVYNTLIVPVGAEYQLLLADGTHVYLNAGSELRFPAAFPGDSREVWLTGEAYFEVARDSARVFKVHTGAMTATVLGTSFDVRDYPERGVATTTLAEGRLRVACGQREYELSPGRQVRFDEAANEAVVLEVDVEQYISWKDGYYCFDGMRLDEVMEMLSVWYGFDVEYADEEVRAYLLTGRLKRYEDYGYLLRKFNETGGIRLEMDGDAVRITKEDDMS